MRTRAPISNGKVLMKPGCYANWRAQRWPVEFRDDRAAAPPEKLLQAVWHRQRLLRDSLTTTDGRKLRVLHPGFWNHESGPDFRGAVIQIDGEPARSGDVEIDLTPSGWHEHGHDRNPAFQNVILQVVWQYDAEAKRDSKTPALKQPTLALKNLLDAPLDELRFALGDEPTAGLPVELLGQCSAPLRELPDLRLTELLHQAAQVRLQAKAAQFKARARQAGWQQALWEGLFAALGYKHNVWPFRRLAELLPGLPAPPRDAALVWQARLFGLGGLLPHEVGKGRVITNDYLKRLWEIWWREREAWAEQILPRNLWRFSGLRPANQPPRRLALAAHWLASGDLPGRLETWLTREIPTARIADSLAKLLQIERDEFWSHHLTFASAKAAKPQALLGEARVTDLAINVILPWFWARGETGRSPAPQGIVEARLFAWPAAEDNAVLKLARQRLLGARPAVRLHTAAAQQGMLQIVRDFCDHSNAVCDQCRFPDLVRTWRLPERAGSAE